MRFYDIYIDGFKFDLLDEQFGLNESFLCFSNRSLNANIVINGFINEEQTRSVVYTSILIAPHVVFEETLYNVSIEKSLCRLVSLPIKKMIFEKTYEKNKGIK